MAEQQQSNNRSQGNMAGNLVYIDDRTALHLAQAFNQELELERLLALVFRQIAAMTDAGGLQYSFEPMNLQLMIGQQERHSADYNLSFQDTPLGNLVLYFSRKQNEQQIQTCEDVLALSFTALRNAIVLRQAQGQPAAPPQPQQPTLSTDRSAEVIPLHTKVPDTDKTDALVLIALDGYEEIKVRSGAEWAQVLMVSVHEQVRDGLRNADGVYHIGDDQIAVLLPNTTIGQAQEVAQKIRTLIASLHLRGNDVHEQLTACMGIADAATAGTAEAVMDNARKALADAQHTGHNQIVLYRAP